MWGTEDNSQRSILYHVSSRDQYQGVRLGGRCLYLPSHLSLPGGADLVSQSCIKGFVTDACYNEVGLASGPPSKPADTVIRFLPIPAMRDPWPWPFSYMLLCIMACLFAVYSRFTNPASMHGLRNSQQALPYPPVTEITQRPQ